jgi:hypothetical protein
MTGRASVTSCEVEAPSHKYLRTQYLMDLGNLLTSRLKRNRSGGILGSLVRNMLLSPIQLSAHRCSGTRGLCQDVRRSTAKHDSISQLQMLSKARACRS